MFKWFWTVFSLGAFSLGVPDTFKPIFMLCEMLENELLPYKSVELNFIGNWVWWQSNLADADKCKWLSLGVAIVCSEDNL